MLAQTDCSELPVHGQDGCMCFEPDVQEPITLWCIQCVLASAHYLEYY